MAKVIRNLIADYINVATGGGTAQWALCGRGFTALDENPGAKVDKTAYICDASASGTIVGYENTFRFDTQLIDDEEAIVFFFEIGRNQKVGTEAEVEYIRVDLFAEPVGGAYPARKFNTAVEIASIAGAATEIVRVTGTLHQVGQIVLGTFNPQTKTFTENAA